MKPAADWHKWKLHPTIYINYKNKTKKLWIKNTAGKKIYEEERNWGSDISRQNDRELMEEQVSHLREKQVTALPLTGN